MIHMSFLFVGICYVYRIHTLYSPANKQSALGWGLCGNAAIKTFKLHRNAGGSPSLLPNQQSFPTGTAGPRTRKVGYQGPPTKHKGVQGRCDRIQQEHVETVQLGRPSKAGSKIDNPYLLEAWTS